MAWFAFPWTQPSEDEQESSVLADESGRERAVTQEIDSRPNDGNEALVEENPVGDGEADDSSVHREAESSKKPQDDGKPDSAASEPLQVSNEATAVKKKPVKLYKSPRLKGYITIILASGIHFNSVQRSGYTSPFASRVVPSTPEQRQYGLAVACVNMILCIPVVICHLDRITPLERIWTSTFGPKSTVELVLTVFLSVWNLIAVGVETSVTGIAGTGKGQFNIYFSVWILCLTSFWTLERWWVEYGWSTFRSFVTSWPYRAPAWICIIILSILDLIWNIDLWRNYSSLGNSGGDVTDAAYEVFNSVPQSQWQWFVILNVFTIIPAVAFVAIELFRDTKADGSTQEKTKVENIVEGVTFLLLVLAWIPTVGAVTTPNGAASLIGNTYFFTWLLVVFLFEGLIWWIHDYRYEIREALRAKEREYRKYQKAVLAKTRQLQEGSIGGATDSDHGKPLQQRVSNDGKPLQQLAAIDEMPGLDLPLSSSSDRGQDVAIESEFFDASESER